jgi:hypothetical protein
MEYTFRYRMPLELPCPPIFKIVGHSRRRDAGLGVQYSSRAAASCLFPNSARLFVPFL